MPEQIWTPAVIASDEDWQAFGDDPPMEAFVLHDGHQWIAVFSEFGEFWLRALDEEEYAAAQSAGGATCAWKRAEDVGYPFTYLVQRDAPAPPPVPRSCAWCDMPATTERLHSDDRLHPSCGEDGHGLTPKDAP